MKGDGERRSYEFGPYRLIPHERLLLRAGEPVPLAPKAFETLVALVRRAGRLASKDELLKEVWPGTFVEESNLAQNVFTLRKVLGEGGVGYIETVPKRGYRFSASVRLVEEVDEQVIERPVSAHNHIAVLPFRLVGAGGPDEYLQLGLADALITKLSNINQLVVRSTSSVRGYTAPDQDPVATGRALRVESVLVGQVQKVGERIRVTVQLVNVGDGRAVWAEKFDQPFSDIFDVQDAISEQVAASLLARVSGEERERLVKRPTDDIEAYQLYLRGNHHLLRFTPADLRKALEYFDEALVLDPGYALAHAGRANAFGIIASLGEDEAASLSEAAATRAVELDPTLAEAHAALGAMRFWLKRDVSGAQEQFTCALRFSPNSATVHHYYAWFLIAGARFPEAEAHMRRALELDPLSPEINVDQGLPLYFARRYGEAHARYTRALELDEESFYVHLRLGEASEAEGMFSRAISEFERALTLSNGDCVVHTQLARALALAGKQREARHLLRGLTSTETPTPFSPYHVALAYAALGSTDEAFAWLCRALNERDKWLGWLRVDPRLDSLRPDTRFNDVLVEARFE